MIIKEILKNINNFDGKIVKLKAWVVSLRGNEKIKFLQINDGSSFASLQVVAKKLDCDLSELNQAKIGSSIYVKGILKLTPNSKQPLEIVLEEFLILAKSENDYPLQKQGMSREYLREIPHLRHRTNLFKAIMRIRSTLMHEIYAYLNERNFLLASSPVITGIDGEGAGESFVIKTASGKDFYDKQATLGVTGQIHAEAYANGFGKVYSFNPIFRAEMSHTQKHASEFWMLEPEVAFHNLDDSIALADDLCKTIIKKTINKHPDEFNFLAEKVDPEIKKRLEKYLNTKIQKIDYVDAIKELKKVNDQFKIKVEGWIDLATEHEKYLAEKLFNGPVAITNFPKEYKAFYMYQNDDQKTVAAFDILVPGIGELLGGSQREHRYEKLLTRMKEMDVDSESFQWYLDLRRFGNAGSAGFGLGFERLIMYVTGVDNIRDVISFPRTSGKLRM